jgi:4-amino-4-deoxy-L-arabinose transferase-like glycosyltransferase
MTSITQMQSPASQRDWPLVAWLVLLIPAAAKLVLHLITSSGYGIHGDELYYIACSNHLDWGYVDQPPLSILLLHLQRAVFGDSLLSIRALPAFAGSSTVLLTGLLARRMGARLFGQLLAELCVFIAGAYLALNHYFSMNAFDVLFWVLALYLVVRIIDGGRPTLWVWLGLVVGLGLQNKLSILFLCFGLCAGLLLTKERRSLFTPWLLAGIGLTLLLILPNIIWQITHGWPTLEWMANARSMKNVSFSLPTYLIEQLKYMHPLTVLVWGTGLIVLFFSRRLARYRSFAWCYLVLFALFVLAGGKPYYLAPMYPALFAAGAMMIERQLTKCGLRAAIVTILLVSGALAAPIAMPLVPANRLVAYSNAIGLHVSSDERHPKGKLSDYFANMFGWQKLAALVASVYETLPPEDQARCGIFTRNYMQAGAIDFFGRQFCLPRAVSGHNNYWLWGTQGYTGEVMIVLGGDAATLQKYFGEVTERARFWDEYVQPSLDGLRIFVVRNPRLPLASLWPALKHYI